MALQADPMLAGAHMNNAADFTKMLPGMDFLQGLVRNAGAALPGINQWVTPTLDPEELDKRIQDLRTVQFWLEQNARLLATTIQALEVQRLTLTTLKTMNLPLADLAQALQARPPAATVPPPPPEPAPPPPPATPEPAPASESAPPPLVDPVQWWGALTQQFGEIAARAMKDGAAVAEAMPGAVPAARAPAPQTDAGSARAAARSRRAPASGAAPAPKPAPGAKPPAARRGTRSGRG
jgi:hypothetical protein